MPRPLGALQRALRGDIETVFRNRDLLAQADPYNKPDRDLRLAGYRAKLPAVLQLDRCACTCRHV